MRERNYFLLVIIIFIALITGWIDQPENPGLNLGPFKREVKVHEGLDLQGGLQVQLEADVPDCQSVADDSMEAAKAIVENRINGLGVAEPVIQRQGKCRIIVELPGINNPDEAIRTFGNTGLLEFIDAGDTGLTEGQKVATTGLSTVFVPGQATPTPLSVSPTILATATIAASPTISSTANISPTATLTPTLASFRTVMSGKNLRTASVAFSQTTNQPYIQFSLDDDGAKIFADYTSKNVGKFLAITIDKTVISSPVIRSAITGGSGIIEGRFTIEEANRLVVQLKYGSLPIPLKVIQSRTVGPTLGRDSVQKSLTAGAVGLLIVTLFMLLYYRLPGLLADLALMIYTMIVFAIYKFGIPPFFSFVTLTLPGIAGFILSVGLAVDANILIFERMKEELRAGRTLVLAIETGFARAWPSIRDSNSSTLITCAILFWFGTNFGASIVAGFALTLAIGVLMSLFTAITVTRTFLRLVIDLGITDNLWLFGISKR
ncbi:MAG: protein translocase subunit SecD [Chloroflexi bacterium]|nr:protein translocase subunit SecD [Chloroflexota bacterium]MBI3742293.1 protein translocase subunit SecD [Chloroflexota bacterium]